MKPKALSDFSHRNDIGKTSATVAKAGPNPSKKYGAESILEVSFRHRQPLFCWYVMVKHNKESLDRWWHISLHQQVCFTDSHCRQLVSFRHRHVYWVIYMNFWRHMFNHFFVFRFMIWRYFCSSWSLIDLTENKETMVQLPTRSGVEASLALEPARERAIASN